MDNSGVAPKAPRRVYVLHSGMNDPTASAAKELEQGLLKRNVPAEDIIILPTPYPSLSDDFADLAEQGRKFQEYQEARERGEDVKPPAPSKHQSNSRIFQASSNPQSEVSQTAYKHYEQALKQAGVKDEDDIVWVGHSAGGQMGTTVSHLAAETEAPDIDTVITLGSPVLEDNAPEKTRVIRYVSPADRVLNNSNGYAGQLWIGKAMTTQSAKPDENDYSRSFAGVNHSAWTSTKRVVDQILIDGNPATHPSDSQLVEAKPEHQPSAKSPFGLSIPGINFFGSAKSDATSE